MVELGCGCKNTATRNINFGGVKSFWGLRGKHSFGQEAINIGFNIGLNIGFNIGVNIGFNIGFQYPFQYWVEYRVQHWVSIFG